MKTPMKDRAVTMQATLRVLSFTLATLLIPALAMAGQPDRNHNETLVRDRGRQAR